MVERVGILIYELFLFWLISIYYQAAWFFPIKKYVMYSLLMSCGMISMFYMWSLEPNIEFTFCALFVMTAFTWAMICGRKTIQKVVRIPAGSYEVFAGDNPNNPDFQLVILLEYQDQVYNLSSVPPDEKPALTLYTQKQNKYDIVFADFTVERNGEPLTWKQWLTKIYHALVFVAAVTLPVFYWLWDNGYTRENYMESCMAIALGYAFTFQLKGNRSLFMRFFYGFGKFLEIGGWLTIPIKIFL